MSLTLVIALQTAAAAAPAPVAPVTAATPPLAIIDWDLARYREPDEPALCRGGGDADVLVCGQRRGGRGSYPLDYWDRLYAPRPIRAEMDLGNNVQGRIYTEAVAMDRGAVSNRAMIGIRMPF